MKKLLITSILYTITTALLLGIAYPLAITAIAQITMRDKANGQLIFENGHIVGSRLIGQPFTGAGYFHSRPSAAGRGYDASASGGSNLAQTNQSLHTRVNASLATEGVGAPIDMVTTSASGLDPDISPAAALFQVPRIAKERRIDETGLREFVLMHIGQRQLGLLGEPHVNVLQLNRDLTTYVEAADQHGHYRHSLRSR